MVGSLWLWLTYYVSVIRWAPTYRPGFPQMRISSFWGESVVQESNIPELMISPFYGAALY